jgi:hypothetical protein
MKSRYYRPSPAAPSSRFSRRDDVAERDSQAFGRHARNLELQERSEAARAAATEAAAQPAANDDQTEKKQNG